MSSFDSNNNNSNNKLPCVYFNHGGGPLPILGQQPFVSQTIQSYSSTLINQPKAILIITAHWVTNIIKISSNNIHSLYFDYYRFPPETYEYKYNAPGSPELADEVINLLKNNNIEIEKDFDRGWDHG